MVLQLHWKSPHTCSRPPSPSPEEYKVCFFHCCLRGSQGSPGSTGLFLTGVRYWHQHECNSLTISPVRSEGPMGRKKSLGKGGCRVVCPTVTLDSSATGGAALARLLCPVCPAHGVGIAGGSCIPALSDSCSMHTGKVYLSGQGLGQGEMTTCSTDGTDVSPTGTGTHATSPLKGDISLL